jgi:hypothetical protein
MLFSMAKGTPWDHSLVRKRKFHPLLRSLGIQQCVFHAPLGNAMLLDQINPPMTGTAHGKDAPQSGLSE